ncbi:HAD family hydrolase [Blastococcus mobilis]|uniref:Haloacid dehalogenase superfamily, subfamily IA, variant 3 with third motif having DD or ED n=1 Tax=Blastococcus mobilis TaxID=1938746 RepID=A0A238YMY9_9ACTN|nr:HAD-IA family hydrolase [Blastococcus mobilis]SNR72525.1 haloacid dehalogenase superfamily, subfamily IA, variant 3 with third motif having DD or ED [Blastococcus mobilis]
MPPVPTPLLEQVQILLCDADGNLFPSEEPAFDASVEVTNAFLAAIGSDRRFTAAELRLAATGLNFRSTAQRLAAEAIVPDVDVEPWVLEEKRAVTAHLARTLRPHGPTSAALTALAEHLPLAAVSSSALARLAACFTAAELDELIPPARRFSAEDSLPTPTSKPDPAVYLHACAQLGIPPQAGLAVEDSLPGALSAVAAGCPTIGNLLFVAPDEREERAAVLEEAGVLAVVSSWQEIADLLLPVLAARRTAEAGLQTTGATP